MSREQFDKQDANMSLFTLMPLTVEILKGRYRACPQNKV